MWELREGCTWPMVITRTGRGLKWPAGLLFLYALRQVWLGNNLHQIRFKGISIGASRPEIKFVSLIPYHNRGLIRIRILCCGTENFHRMPSHSWAGWRLHKQWQHVGLRWWEWRCLFNVGMVRSPRDPFSIFVIIFSLDVYWHRPTTGSHVW